MWLRGCLILSYHHIAETSIKTKANRFYISPKNFERHMEYLSKNRYSVLELSELVDILRKRKDIPPKSIVLTFDDGYRSLLTTAKDIVKSYGFRSTAFISTGRIGGINDWDEGVKDDINIMPWHEIRSLLRDGFSFHSHGVNHIKLTVLSDQAIMEELVRSRETLESKFGQKRNFFCYPFSEFNDNVKRMVKEAGYACACTTVPGVNNRRTDLFLLKRIDIKAEDNLARFIYKINYCRFLYGFRHG